MEETFNVDASIATMAELYYGREFKMKLVEMQKSDLVAMGEWEGGDENRQKRKIAISTDVKVPALLERVAGSQPMITICETQDAPSKESLAHPTSTSMKTVSTSIVYLGKLRDGIERADELFDIAEKKLGKVMSVNATLEVDEKSPGKCFVRVSASVKYIGSMWGVGSVAENLGNKNAARTVAYLKELILKEAPVQERKRQEARQEAEKAARKGEGEKRGGERRGRRVEMSSGSEETSDEELKRRWRERKEKKRGKQEHRHRRFSEEEVKEVVEEMFERERKKHYPISPKREEPIDFDADIVPPIQPYTAASSDVKDMRRQLAASRRAPGLLKEAEQEMDAQIERVRLQQRLERKLNKAFSNSLSFTIFSFFVPLSGLTATLIIDHLKDLSYLVDVPFFGKKRMLSIMLAGVILSFICCAVAVMKSWGKVEELVKAVNKKRTQESALTQRRVELHQGRNFNKLGRWKFMGWNKRDGLLFGFRARDA